MENTTNAPAQTNAATSPRNWAEIGITWEQGTVQKRDGKNSTDLVAYSTPAELPTVANEEDFDKFVKHFGKGRVLGMFTASNSLRVGAQAICRGLLEENAKPGTENMREQVYAWMMGTRTRSQIVRTVTVTIRYLPDGTAWEGTDETTFRQDFAAALIDNGVDPEKALEKARNAKW